MLLRPLPIYHQDIERVGFAKIDQEKDDPGV